MHPPTMEGLAFLERHDRGQVFVIVVEIMHTNHQLSHVAATQHTICSEANFFDSQRNDRQKLLAVHWIRDGDLILFLFRLDQIDLLFGICSRVSPEVLHVSGNFLAGCFLLGQAVDRHLTAGDCELDSSQTGLGASGIREMDDDLEVAICCLGSIVAHGHVARFYFGQCLKGDSHRRGCLELFFRQLA